MPIEIEGPDGIVNEFPDGTPEATITGVMARHYPSPTAPEAPGGLPSTPGSAPLLPDASSAASGASPSLPPQFGGRAIELAQSLGGGLVDWIRNNPQEVADFIGQGIGTTGGIAAGSPGGPAGMVAGGAAGSVLGKKAARWVMGGEQPDAVESTIDAATGAVGPALGTAARGVSRLATGLSREGVTAVEQAGARQISRLTAKAKGIPEITKADIEFAINRTRDLTANKVQWAVDNSLERAAGRKITNAVIPAGVGALFAGLEPITGALLGAGVGDAILSRALPKLLSSTEWGPRFATWALNVEKNTPKKAELAASFAALLADAGINSDIKGSFEPSQRGTKPLRGADGKFKSPTDTGYSEREPVDHSQLEDLFGK